MKLYQSGVYIADVLQKTMGFSEEASSDRINCPIQVSNPVLVCKFISCSGETISLDS